MKINNLFFILLCCSFFFTSCLTTRHTNLLQDDGQVRKEVSEKEALKEYRVCSGDELRITVLSLNPETNTLFSLFSPTVLRENQGNSTSGLTSFPIHTDGTIDFPYLGAVSVKGKTTLEIKLLMEEKLAVITKDDCSVQVELNNRFFSVIGESTVGRYPIVKEKTTILQALAQAHDIKPYGDRTKVKVIRQTEDGTLIREFDIQSSSIVNSEFYYIQPNDVIYIQPMGRQFWGMNSFGAIFAVLSTVTSIGLLIYNFVK